MRINKSVSFNRLANCGNPYQGKAKRVLCVCSAGLLRSPTAAVILSQAPYNFNTRAAGLSEDFALIYADDALLMWADEIVCMTRDQQKTLKKRTKKKIICLNINDDYPYMDEKLIDLIKTSYRNLTETKKSKKLSD